MSALTCIDAEHSLAELARAACAGDQSAWDEIVERFSALLWSITRNSGLSGSDAADVCQTTWLRLVEHLPSIEQPERIGAWLATTARREAIRTSQRRRRDVLSSDDRVFDAARTQPAPELSLSRDARGMSSLSAAVEHLPERSRTLLSLLIADPPIPYTEISEILSMPIGSIGPTRARVLAGLRARLEHDGISAADLAAG